jgi:hypothetical protein
VDGAINAMSELARNAARMHRETLSARTALRWTPHRASFNALRLQPPPALHEHNQDHEQEHGANPRDR